MRIHVHKFGPRKPELKAFQLSVLSKDKAIFLAAENLQPILQVTQCLRWTPEHDFLLISQQKDRRVMQAIKFQRVHVTLFLEHKRRDRQTFRHLLRLANEVNHVVSSLQAPFRVCIGLRGLRDWSRQLFGT